MPSPIAHLAAGCAIYRGWRAGTSRTWLLVGAALFFSLLPDCDAAIGILLGNLARYHNNLTHSLTAAFAAGLLGLSLGFVLDRPAATRWFGLAFTCYGLHVAMDFFTVGRGVMFLWPFTSHRFISPIKLFYGLHWSQGVFSRLHIWTFLSETAFILVVLVALWGVRAAHFRIESGKRVH